MGSSAAFDMATMTPIRAITPEISALMFLDIRKASVRKNAHPGDRNIGLFESQLIAERPAPALHGLNFAGAVAAVIGATVRRNSEVSVLDSSRETYTGFASISTATSSAGSL